MFELRDQMITALSDAEKAMQKLRQAEAKLTTAVNAVLLSAEPRERATFEATLGVTQFHDLLVRRLRALGLGPMLAQARTTGRVPDSWVRDWTGVIHNLVRR